MVFDTRIGNSLCRSPPSTPLATAGALSNTRLPRPGSVVDGIAFVGVCSVVDLVDSFYLFSYSELAELFCTGPPVLASDYDIHVVRGPCGRTRPTRP